MVRQKTPLLKRLLVGSLLSGLLFGFGGFIAHTPAAFAQPAVHSIHQTSLTERLYAQVIDPYSDPDVIEQERSGE
ncbi:MAG TPA: hypothetical protein VL485_12120 [Ktedonobacteraceae bacterium]|jgi:hypothetical protein|nr:hypothetical protein [Ktedonobacteraceae bacterium]